MFYEECTFYGVTYCRSSPDGEWRNLSGTRQSELEFGGHKARPPAEAVYMDACRVGWETRCRKLMLKRGTLSRKYQVEAYLLGVVACAVGAGLMDLKRAGQIALLISLDQAEEFLAVLEPQTPLEGDPT